LGPFAARDRGGIADFVGSGRDKMVGGRDEGLMMSTEPNTYGKRKTTMSMQANNGQP
jgi:hypothetical protein